MCIYAGMRKLKIHEFKISLETVGGTTKNYFEHLNVFIYSSLCNLLSLLLVMENTTHNNDHFGVSIRGSHSDCNEIS